ncbi:MAG: SdrD B-like domain-containing protein, partial [Desertimonas sp.]
AGPLAVGASFDCTASLTDVVPGSVHEDVATVNGVGAVTGNAVDDENPYHAITPAVSVGDFVWLDDDHDGVQDAGEPGIPGVTLTLTGPGGEPVTDVHGNVVAPAVTDGSGYYEFIDLPPLPPGEHYTVTVTPPAGYLPTIEGGTPGVGDDSSTGSATSVDLVADGARDDTLDFGFWIPEPGISILKGDTDGNTGDDPADPVVLPDGTASLTFTVANTGSEDLLEVSVADVTTGSGTVESLTCTFPDGTAGTTWAGPFVVGASFDCTASLTGVTPGSTHEDVATVTGVGAVTGNTVTDDNPYHATSPAGAVAGAVETAAGSTRPLPSTGSSVGDIVVVAAALGAGGALLLLMARRRRTMA